MTDAAAFLIDDADVPALRNAVSRIARAGYCETRVRERLGLSDLNDLRWRALPIYREEQLAVRDLLASAIDLFLLQGAIPSDELNRLFDKADRDVLMRAGLLSIDEKGVAHARASLFPVGDCLVFSDHAWPMLPHPGCANVPHDQVMSIGTDSRWLARVTVRRPVGSRFGSLHRLGCPCPPRSLPLTASDRSGHESSRRTVYALQRPGLRRSQYRSCGRGSL